MNAPSVDVATLLAGETDLALEIAGNLHVGDLPDPTDSGESTVAIYDTTGYAPEHNYVYLRPTLQVFIRGPRGQYRDGYDLAGAIRDFLISQHGVTVDGAHYIGIWAETDVLFVGWDDNHYPQFSVNFRLHRTDV